MTTDSSSRNSNFNGLPPAVTIAGSFVKGNDLYYTAISPLNARMFGLPENYDAAMRLSDFSGSKATFEDPEIYHAEDVAIITNNTTVCSEATLLSVEGEWIRLYLRKQRTPQGGIYGQTLAVSLHAMYGGWPGLLDRKREMLPLPNGEKLTRADLRALHGFVHGIPRKLMASGLNVSVKAVEKRLKRIRDKLHHPHCSCYSLHGCLNWYDLMPMIMDRYDWFDLTPGYKVYPATARPLP